MKLTNQAMLITYADSMGSNLAELDRLLEKHFKPAVGGVHLLPFFPSSGDRGFSPETYQVVDSRFGSWEDVDRIGKHFYLMFDLMINHLSKHSVQFQDYLQKKNESPSAKMFLNWDRFWSEVRPTEADIDMIYKRKDKAPKQEIKFADGTTTHVWNTFGPEQIDLDVDSEATKAFLKNALDIFSKHHASIVRLDAFAYAIKKLGTNDFFVEPEIWYLLDHIQCVAKQKGMQVLPEIHERYTLPKKVNAHGYYTYDFALPMLILYTIYSKNDGPLLNWLKVSPMRQFTTLDTHDGIGVVDVKGILTDRQIDYTVKQLYQQGSNVKKVYSSSAYNNLDIYQINTTYYSALGNEDQTYLLARAIQIFAPGIPQIYYVGLLAGSNDLSLLEKTKEGRNINRHYYTVDEVEREIERPVVKDLLKLLTIRNTSAAFDLSGHLAIDKKGDQKFMLRRTDRTGRHKAELSVDLKQLTFFVTVDGEKIDL